MQQHVACMLVGSRAKLHIDILLRIASGSLLDVASDLIYPVS